MGQIKIGIVGLGNMGMTYAKALLAGLIPAARLTAICVNGTAKAVKASGEFDKSVQCFGDFFFSLRHMRCGILVPLPKIKPLPPELRTQRPYHLAINEVLDDFFK